jgi:hypothetical protein
MLKGWRNRIGPVKSADIKPGDAPMYEERKKQGVISQLQRLSAGSYALLKKSRVDDTCRNYEGHGTDGKVFPKGSDIEPPRAAKEDYPDNGAKDESLTNPKDFRFGEAPPSGHGLFRIIHESRAARIGSGSIGAPRSSSSCRPGIGLGMAFGRTAAAARRA